MSKPVSYEHPEPNPAPLLPDAYYPESVVIAQLATDEATLFNARANLGLVCTLMDGQRYYKGSSLDTWQARIAPKAAPEKAGPAKVEPAPHKGK